MDIEEMSYDARRQAIADFEELVQTEGIFVFYGAVGNEFRLNDIVWEAVEDPDDGYRSYLGCIIQTESTSWKLLQQPLAAVKVMHVEDRPGGWGKFEGWVLVDIFDGHEWLYIGTDNSDDYYPCFTFDYNPKEPVLN